HIQAQISRLNSLSLRCFWKITTKQISDSSVFLERPKLIEDEMFRLSINALDSEKDANFAIKELLPTLSTDGMNQALEIILENYEKFKKEEK
ncbi:MAG: metallophosphoesterase, partial [Candidatus Nitrosopumilus limneticus]|nr:metallophosphoesterase [Candidatus Nitrosopumilus limneticus]